MDQENSPEKNSNRTKISTSNIHDILQICYLLREKGILNFGKMPSVVSLNYTF